MNQKEVNEMIARLRRDYKAELQRNRENMSEDERQEHLERIQRILDSMRSLGMKQLLWRIQDND